MEGLIPRHRYILTLSEKDSVWDVLTVDGIALSHLHVGLDVDCRAVRQMLHSINRVSCLPFTEPTKALVLVLVEREYIVP